MTVREKRKIDRLREKDSLLKEIFDTHHASLKQALWRCARDIEKGRLSSRWVNIEIGTRSYQATLYRVGLHHARWQVVSDDGEWNMRSDDFLPPPSQDGVFALRACLAKPMASGTRHHLDREMTFDVDSEAAVETKAYKKAMDAVKNARLKSGSVVKRNKVFNP